MNAKTEALIETANEVMEKVTRDLDFATARINEASGALPFSHVPSATKFALRAAREAAARAEWEVRRAQDWLREASAAGRHEA